jgi:hypothetical protein
LFIENSANQVPGCWKFAQPDRFLISGFAVQFDKVDQYQPVRRLTAIFGLGKHGALVVRCHPRSQFHLTSIVSPEVSTAFAGARAPQLMGFDLLARAADRILSA